MIQGTGFGVGGAFGGKADKRVIPKGLADECAEIDRQFSTAVSNCSSSNGFSSNGFNSSSGLSGSSGSINSILNARRRSRRNEGGASRHATLQSVFKKLVKRWHPDKATGNTEVLK
jgi:hypothetical protein